MLYAIMGSIIGLAVLIAIACIVVAGILTHKNKGDDGERLVSEILGDTVEGEQYVINDLMFGNDKGQSCQIDHVYINKHGIWVIETKNYAGVIFGTELAREWTQCLADGNTVNKFYNPIKQNVTHIYRLGECLDIKDKNVFRNVVVFLSRADISKIEASTFVYSVYELETIKTFDTGVTLSPEQMKGYYLKLIDLKNNNKISKREHIRNIHKMQRAVAKGICPRCGAKLVLRNGEFGEFYGCSNYPTCKFTKNKD